MKKRLLVLFATLPLLLAAAFLVWGWSAVPDYVPQGEVVFAAPFRTMAEHDAVMRGSSWPYIVRREGDDGSLLYFGSAHTRDPDDPQIGRIVELWAEFDPTVAVTENRLGLFLGSDRMAIRRFGEFAAVAALARRDGVPLYSVEPSWEVEVEEAKSAFPVEEVTLFYTLRVFLSERGRGRSPSEVDDLAAHLLRKRGSRPGLEGSLPDLAALDRLWEERFAHLGPWRELSREAIHPNPQPDRLSAIANLVNEVRDRHAARVILDLVARGERVFGIAGGSHVVKQEPVLEAGLS